MNTTDHGSASSRHRRSDPGVTGTPAAADLDMYPPVEREILRKYFVLPGRADPDIDLWGEPSEEPSGTIRLLPDSDGARDLDRALSNAVARIALDPVQRQLPQLAMFDAAGDLTLGRNITPQVPRQIAGLARHLFTIDWAMTAPGISWPEAYWLAWLPGVERWVVVASRDSTDIGGYTDNVVGSFGPAIDVLDGVRDIITECWQRQFDAYDHQRWEMFFADGMVGYEAASTWADSVWACADPEPGEEASHA